MVLFTRAARHSVCGRTGTTASDLEFPNSDFTSASAFVTAGVMSRGARPIARVSARLNPNNSLAWVELKHVLKMDADSSCGGKETTIMLGQFPAAADSLTLS